MPLCLSRCFYLYIISYNTVMFCALISVFPAIRISLGFSWNNSPRMMMSDIGLMVGMCFGIILR